MYYPYLRGKQFELLALREFVSDYADNCQVFPIIEPVKSSFNSMKIAIKKLKENNVCFALILNPRKGDLIGKVDQIIEQLSDLLTNDNTWIPAYIASSKNSKAISTHIKKNNFNSALLVCDDSIDITQDEFKKMLEMPEITKIVFKDSNRSFKRELTRLGKETIRLDDNFKAQKRNKDYVSIPEEMFSEEVFYYKSEDGFTGFSDYTVLSSEYIDGGMLPNALAIHLTYKKHNEIWIRHFVSDTNDDNSNIQGKFGEAAEKAISFFDSLPYTNKAIDELFKYFIEGQYPGLGVLKKLSIKSHLELINSILTTQA